MFSAADKTSPSTHVARAKSSESEGPFFGHATETDHQANPFFGSNTFFHPQPKLEISQPDDPQEREADAVADEVMSMQDTSPVAEEKEDSIQTKPDSPASTPFHRFPIASRIHRQEGPGGFASNAVTDDAMEGQVQTKAQTGVSSWIARRARGPPASQPDSTSHSFERSLASTKGSGSPMPISVRSWMETRLGADFGGVRVHTGSSAQSLSASIHAKAFTHGNDVYFNRGHYAPESTDGQRLLAHELTHTIQQGASTAVSPKANRAPTHNSSSPGHANSAPLQPAVLSRRSIQRQDHVIHRAEAESQRLAAVELARAEQGLVSASETGPDGKRMGWERLLEYFQTTFGKSNILPEGAAHKEGTVNEGAIKQKSTFKGDAMASDGTTLLHNQERDVLPSWCGIFAFWALNKGGIPLKKWTLGRSMFPPEAAYPPGHQPQPGDIAWRREFSHFGLVASSDGSKVNTVNGNTAGDDNLGGQVQEQTHPIDHWFAFFDPASIQDGPLQAPGQGIGAAEQPVRSLAELRKSLFGVSRKVEGNGTVARAEDEGSAVVSNHVAEGSVASASRSSTPAPAAEVARQADVEEQRQEGEQEELEGEGSVKNGTIAREADSADPVESESVTALSREPTEEQDAEEPIARDALASRPTELENTGRPADGPPHEHRLPDARGPPQRGPSIHHEIQTKLSRQQVQRGWLGDAWDAVSGAVGEAAAWIEEGLDRAKAWLLGKVRDFVAEIPGYKVLSLILEADPITGEAYALTGRSLLEAGLDVLPFGSMFRAVMNRLGIFNDVATWLEGRIGAMRTLASGIASRFLAFWDDLSISDVGDPDGVMNRVGNLLRSTITSIVDFVTDSASTFLNMVKEVMIREIAAFVRTRIPRLYPLLKVALGFDPETLETVERNGTNILDAFLMVSDEGQEQRRQMIETGTYQRIVSWVDRGIEVFSTAWVELRAAIMGIWDLVTIENLFSPLATLERIYNSFATPIGRVTRFMIDAAIEIIRVIKDALLSRLSAYARETRGYSLLTVIIGRDPFTGQRVERTVHNIVKGFMGLMEGGEQQYEQLKEAGAIDRIVAKVEAAVERLNMTPQAIIQLFIDLWNSFSLRDLANPFAAFARIVRTFGAPIFRLARFVIEILMIVIEAILILMNFPFDVVASIIENARAAWNQIKANVPEFFKNVLRSIKQGFVQFFDNIGTHLLNGVVGWLMSELSDAGIPTLSDFSLQGVIGWVLEVLGISMEKIWEKLAEHPRIGPERVAMIRGAIDTLTGIWTFIQDVRERGMAAIWDKIREQLTNLWDTVLDAVKSWIMERIITAVVTKLLSFLDPTGIMAVINSAIAIYNAVQSFIKYLTEMLQVINSFVRGIREIASGAIGGAANYLENAMDQAMPIVIGFLANQVGLGGVGRRVGEMIERVREMVDQAIGWLVNKAVDTGMALLDRVMAMAGGARDAIAGWLGLRKSFTDSDGRGHSLYWRGSGASARMVVESAPMPIAEVFSTVAARVAEPGNEEAKAAYDQAVPLNGEIDALKARLAVDANYPTAESRTGDEGQLSQKMDLLKQKLGLLMPHLSPHPLPTEADVTMPLSANNHSFATSMVADKIYKVGFVNSKGSTPSQARHNLYDPINARRKGNGSYYIRGHLLNHNIGGPGLWSNMTALSREGNSRHEKEVESKVKAQFNQGKVIHYEVHTEGRFAPGSAPATLQDAKDRFTSIPDADTKFSEIVSLIHAEQSAGIPAGLRCSAHTMKYEGGAWVNDESIVATTVGNPVESAPTSYDLAGGGAPAPTEVSINSADAGHMSLLPGVGATLAARIIAARPFAAFAELETKVEGIGPTGRAAIENATAPSSVL